MPSRERVGGACEGGEEWSRDEREGRREGGIIEERRMSNRRECI